MDEDIFFSRPKKKNSDVHDNGRDIYSNTQQSGEETFQLNFAPRDEEKRQAEIRRHFQQDAASGRPMYPGAQSEEEMRTPRELRNQNGADDYGQYVAYGNRGESYVPYAESQAYEAEGYGYVPVSPETQRNAYSNEAPHTVYTQREAPSAPEYRTGAVTDEYESWFAQSDSPKMSAAEPSKKQVAEKEKAVKPKVNKKAKKGMSRGAAVAISIIAVIFICLIGVGAYGFSLLSSLSYDEYGIVENQYIDSSVLASDKAVTNILLIGCDNANGAAFSRSDTMMLVSIDRNNKAIKLSSFLRDSYVHIPAKNYSAKLNSACSAGGPQYVVDTIEYNFHVDIENYVMVDFDMFTDLVNALGGVDVEISQKEADFLNNNCSFVGATEGVNHFAGWQALTYCRIRKLAGESDFNRTARQRKVISAIIAKAKTSDVFGLVGQIDGVLANVQTDMPKAKLISLGVGAVLSYLRYDIKQMQVPANGTWWNATVSGQGAVLKMNLEENQKLLYDFLYTEDEETTAQQ